MTTVKKNEITFLHILTALNKGEENAIHQIDLANKIGVPTWRLKKIIQAARKSGVMIISSKRGYYLSDNKQEINHFVRMMSKQAATRYGSITKIRKTMPVEIGGQLSMKLSAAAAGGAR
ncbi:MAG: hypothetical protein K6G45_13055 [Lachnospiraceae bacterium]|nr:hypothetical protein [Lachnospiraceae bacterium]